MQSEMRAGRREGMGWRRRKRRARMNWRLGVEGKRAERTSNMPPMVVTLDVSKLSGWLKAGAPCRVEMGACDAGT